MPKAVICEDEKEVREYLERLVKEQAPGWQVSGCASAAECLLRGADADLVILDIGLGSEPDGIALARKLRQRGGERPLVVFVTGHPEYVSDAFDVGAFQYLLKPIDERRFAEVFARAQSRLAGKDAGRMLTLRLGSLSRTIPIRDIRYIEGSNHRAVVHMQGEMLSSYTRLKVLEAELEGQFFRIHKGYLVSLWHIQAYSRSEVVLKNGEKLPLAKHRYPAFVEAYTEFLCREGGNG